MERRAARRRRSAVALAILVSACQLEAPALATPAVEAAAVQGGRAGATDLPTFERSLPKPGPRDLQGGDDLFALLPLRRPCLAARPCGIALLEPASPRGALLPEAERLAALIALTLSQREALCIDDAHGRWSQVAGEPLRRCPHRDERHAVQVRLAPAEAGFLATVTFTEADAPTSSEPQRAVPAQGVERMPLTPVAGAPEPQRLRLRAEFDEARDLDFTAERIGDALGDALGTDRPSVFEVFLRPPEAPIVHVNIKLGNTLAALDGFDFSAFTLRFDVEADYYLRPYLMAFLEAGLAIGNAENTGAEDVADDEGAGEATPDDSGDDEVTGDEESAGRGSFSFVPVKIGLKYNPLYQYSVRPYIGAGIGLGILSDLVEAESREITLSFSGILGVAWVPFNHLGFNFETSFNFDELRISGGSNVLFGFSVNFGVLILY